MDVARLNSKCVSRNKGRSTFSKSYYCLLYKRTSKERRKGNPPTLSTLSLYTIHLPPSNHSSCSDIPSESHPMILHTTPLFLYRNNHATSPDVATPQLTSLSILNYTATISPLLPRLPTSPPFRNTIPSTPSRSFFYISKVPSYLLTP